ncbi:MAG: riboflavin synthase [Ignavibacteria bacterium]|nr:riboflavin synthase [Ignavibacteria bacterium]
MFTGIVEEKGKVVKKTKINEGFKFRVRSKLVGKKLAKSDSVSINGVCHTVTTRSKTEFDFVSMHETLKKTNIGELNTGDEVNLEGSLTMNKKLGGHFVAGHVDDTGIITEVKQIKAVKKEDSDNWEYRIKIHKRHAKYVIYVGSIAVDGVSLTVAEVTKPKGNYFDIKVAIIPYTYNNTSFGKYKAGDRVNLEFDFLGKYVLNLLEQNPKIKKLVK